MSRRSERAKALAEKKAKLAELRARREARKKAPTPVSMVVTSGSQASPSSQRDEVHALVDSLLSKPKAGSDSPLIAKSIDRDGGSDAMITQDAGPPAASASASKAEATPAPFHGDNHSEKRAALTLTSFVSLVSIPSSRIESYEKSTQTDPVSLTSVDSGDTSIKSPAGSPRTRSRRRSKRSNSADLQAAFSTADSEAREAASSNPLVTQADDKVAQSKSANPRSSSVAHEPEFDFLESARRVLNEHEQAEIEESAVFSDFLSSASGVIERALNQAATFDPTVIYGGRTGDEESGRDDFESRVAKVREYFQPTLEGRAVTDICWSPHYKELFLSAYGSEANSSNSFMNGMLGLDMDDDIISGENDFHHSLSSDGLVLVWSLFRPKIPEFVFTCQSPVMAAKFDPFSKNLVVGSTFSGQIVLWDKRAKSAPVQRTPLSATGHTHPVFSLEMVGSANANKLVTVSTDGRLCAWSLGALSEPSDATTLSADSKGDVAVTSISFASGDANEFCAGAEDGCVYAGQVHGQKSSTMKKYGGCHHGPITSLQFHPIPSESSAVPESASRDDLKPSNASGSDDSKRTESVTSNLEAVSGKAKSLLLTSSVDWTVKLWSHSPRDAQNPLREVASFGSSRDYVYDVRWSPVHPGLFCYVDGAGMLHLWNINRSVEEPILRVMVTEDGKTGCNKVRWSDDGRKIIVGDSAGKVHLYDVAGLIATARHDSWAKLDDQIASMRESRT